MPQTCHLLLSSIKWIFLCYSAITQYYSLVLKEKNWTNAQEYCRQHYTNLSIIHTEEDWKAIQYALSNFRGDVWIGLNGIGSVQTQKWSWSDGEDLMFLNWDGGFGSVLNIHCAVSVSSRFRQQLCNTPLPYMCQYGMGSPFQSLKLLLFPLQITGFRHDNGVTDKVYELITEPKNQEEAVKACNHQQGELASICNQKEQDADVTQLLANVELACGGVWIGLERSIFEWNAPWLWTSGDVDMVVKYSEWHSCFPLNPINYHCGKMVRVGNGELKWLDASCHQELPFICQDTSMSSHPVYDVLTDLH
uniref:C-type lectin domain-containing protein n=1 Tax=Salmo trutta TaxID=8032 RepID=A0A674DR55_SALTR